MKKEFYVGQPLIVKETGEKVTFAYNDSHRNLPCSVIKNGNYSYCDYYGYEQLEPSTELKFSELIAGLEQDYFDVGTWFESRLQTFVVCETLAGLGLREKDGNPMIVDVNVNSGSINTLWTIVEPDKEMTLEEIEAELGYKVKLKNNGGN